MFLLRSIGTVSLFLLLVASCKSKGTDKEKLTKQIEVNLEENNPQKKIKNKDDNTIKLVLGEVYGYGNKEYPILATKVYLQVGNGKKNVFPFAVTETISKEIPANIKANFNPEEVDKNTQPEFELYYTRYNRYFAFIGIKKEDKLLIYRKEITFEDEVRAENGDNLDEYIFFELIAEYSINRTDLKLLYSRDDNYYTYAFEQDFFEPISYSEEEIREFIISKYQSTFIGNSNNFFTKRFFDFQNDAAYYYEEALTLGQKRQVEDTYKAVYNLEEWKDAIEISFSCPYVDYGHLSNLKIKGEVKEEKKEGKYYTGKLFITILGSEKEVYTCKKDIRLVQINGLLYFDYMQILYD